MKNEYVSENFLNMLELYDLFCEVGLGRAIRVSKAIAKKNPKIRRMLQNKLKTVRQKWYDQIIKIKRSNLDPIKKKEKIANIRVALNKDVRRLAKMS